MCVTKELFDSRRDYERMVRNQFRSRGGRNKKDQMTGTNGTSGIDGMSGVTMMTGITGLTRED